MAIVGLIIHFGICFWVAKMAEEAGKSFWFYLFVSFFTSALVGLIILKVNQ